MATTLISAVSAVDIVFFVILGIALLGGIIGGLARAFKGVFIAILTILLSVLLVGATLAPIRNWEVCQKLENSLTAKTDGWGEVFTQPIYIARDENGQPFVDENGNPTTFYINVNDQKITLDAVADSGLVNKTRARLAKRLAQKYITLDNEGQSLSGLAANVLADIIVEIILFVIYCVLIGLVLFLLRRLMLKLHNSSSTLIRVLDRVLGAVVAVAIALIGMMIILTIIRGIAGTDSTVGKYFAESPAIGNLYLHNPAAGILTRLFG